MGRKPWLRVIGRFFGVCVLSIIAHIVVGVAGSATSGIEAVRHAEGRVGGRGVPVVLRAVSVRAAGIGATGEAIAAVAAERVIEKLTFLQKHIWFLGFFQRGRRHWTAWSAKAALEEGENE